MSSTSRAALKHLCSLAQGGCRGAGLWGLLPFRLVLKETSGRKTRAKEVPPVPASLYWRPPTSLLYSPVPLLVPERICARSLLSLASLSAWLACRPALTAQAQVTLATETEETLSRILDHVHRANHRLPSSVADSSSAAVTGAAAAGGSMGVGGAEATAAFAALEVAYAKYVQQARRAKNFICPRAQLCHRMSTLFVTELSCGAWDTDAPTIEAQSPACFPRGHSGCRRCVTRHRCRRLAQARAGLVLLRSPSCPRLVPARSFLLQSPPTARSPSEAPHSSPAASSAEREPEPETVDTSPSAGNRALSRERGSLRVHTELGELSIYSFRLCSILNLLFHQDIPFL